MIKRSLIVASLLVAGTNAIAQDINKYYVGIGLNIGSGTQTREYSSGGEYETEYDASSTNIKFGFLKSNGNRLEISIEKISADQTGGNAFNANDTFGDKTSEFIGYNLDYLFVFNSENKLKPYVDLGLGVYKNDEISGYNTSTGDPDTATGIAVNLGAGLIYGITDNIEIESAYKIKSIAWNLDNPDTREIINMMYIGANIKF